MARTKLSPEALADIRAALIFTRARYGVGKAQEYRALIREARLTLSQNPRLGTARPEIAPEARIFPIAQTGRPARHLFVYELLDNGDIVHLVAFLYDAMDLSAQLQGRKPR
jgi:plasmid stabilization system protein ParE